MSLFLFKSFGRLTAFMAFVFVLFLSNVSAQSYCSTKGTFPWEQWIERVYVATGVGSSVFPTTGKDGYGDFTNVSAATLQRGQAGLIGINPQSSWGADPRNTNMFWRVWIDLNNDNDFDDAGEMVISRQVVVYAGVFLDNEQAFVVPATANLGKTRMRVALKVGGYPLLCETFERGEVEDYTVNIVGQPTIGNDTLRLVSVTGATTVRQGEKITLNVTIKNTGTTPSSPSTPLSIYQNQQPIIQRGPPPTFLKIVSDRTPIGRIIQPNEMVTVPVVFTVFPNFSHISRPDYSGVVYNGTYVVIGNRANDISFNIYFNPVLDTLTMPYTINALLDNSDLKINIVTTDTTYKKEGKHSFTVKVTNNGTIPVKDVIANLGTATGTFGGSVFSTPTITPQRGTITYPTLFGSPTNIVWNIGTLAPTESVTALMQYEKFEITIVLPEFIHEVKVGSNQIIDNVASNDVARQRFVLDTTVSTSYCAAKGIFPWEQWIDHVYVATATGSLVYPTTAKEGYGNFTNATAATIQRGQAVLLGIEPKSSWNADPRNANMFWRAWIDLNNDNDFDDAGEQVMSRQIVISNGTFLDNEQAFVLPATANLGKTRMRITMKVGAYPTPCEIFERGEVEDYSVNIVNPPSAIQSLYSNIQNIDSQKLNDFTLFPNPTSEEVFLDLKAFQNKTIHLSISNLIGQTVYTETIESANPAPHRLAVSMLESGVYYIRVETRGNRAVVRKLVIE